MAQKTILTFVAGFATAMVLARLGVGKSLITGGNKYFN